MKIVMVNTSDTDGGAARAAYRLHNALLKSNVDSSMLVQFKNSDDYTVIGPLNMVGKIINLIRSRIDILPTKKYKQRDLILFSPLWLPYSGIVDKINKINPDIVHLHWVCGGMIKLEDIAKIKSPIVWSFHDDWGFTGGCHIKWECDKYKHKCGACPRLGSQIENDLSRKVYLRKKKVLSQVKNMTVVGVSKWLTSCVSESSLFKNVDAVTLPNPIDINTYKPFDKNTSRDLWELPQNKKLIMFGAMDVTSDVNKGFKELREALVKVSHNDVEVVIFGGSKPKEPQELGFKTNYVGVLRDDISLVTLYSAADVVIVPSIQESFGQTASESMACGTPVVAFASTGLLDIIDHKINGYLATPFDTDDLAKGIDWVLSTENYQELSKNAREKIKREFDSNIVAKKYLELYKKVVKH
ncbi:MAG: glycosyltransferase family 4 protein [Fibrobacterales bacterium]